MPLTSRNRTCLRRRITLAIDRLLSLFTLRVHWGRHPAQCAPPCLIFFPVHQTLFGCGLAGIVAYRNPSATDSPADALQALEAAEQEISKHSCTYCSDRDLSLNRHFLGGPGALEKAFQAARTLKANPSFCHLFSSPGDLQRLKKVAARLAATTACEGAFFEHQAGRMEPGSVEAAAHCLETLKDISWALEKELLGNIDRVRDLMAGTAPEAESLTVYKQINSVLNAIDRLEVRGRDSAGISVMFTLEAGTVDALHKTLVRQGLEGELDARREQEVLKNNGIAIHPVDGSADLVAMAFTYKVAAEIGSLGDNIGTIRTAIRKDPLLSMVSALPRRGCTVSSHTRWASVGAITEANCHPVDSHTPKGANEILHVCLNGDIDNYRDLKAELEAQGQHIHANITSDTKIIPLLIAHYRQQGHDVAEAFRLAVSRFEGSHAITMHTSMAPGKLFLAQKGSGQAIFIGLGTEHYMPASEVYGFVEETPCYLKVDGETVVEGKRGPIQGQVFILDQESGGGVDGITAMYYDGTPWKSPRI
jgi:glucosamine--fructose-6-phosphate aminotransferase (isomerizing)